MPLPPLPLLLLLLLSAPPLLPVLPDGARPSEASQLRPANTASEYNMSAN
jgi:hypothetical protein